MVHAARRPAARRDGGTSCTPDSREQVPGAPGADVRHSGHRGTGSLSRHSATDDAPIARHVIWASSAHAQRMWGQETTDRLPVPALSSDRCCLAPHPRAATSAGRAPGRGVTQPGGGGRRRAGRHRPAGPAADRLVVVTASRPAARRDATVQRTSNSPRYGTRGVGLVTRRPGRWEQRTTGTAPRWARAEPVVRRLATAPCGHVGADHGQDPTGAQPDRVAGR